MDRRTVLGGGLAAAVWAGAARAQTMPVSAPATAQPGLEALEPVQAVIAGPKGVIVRVASDGCTTKADFAIYVDRGPNGPAVAFGRRPVDKCKVARRSAEHVDLSFSYLELGVDAQSGVRVLNPIGGAIKNTSSPRLSRRPTP